ncbi:hypothetical protein P879_03100 [Paragonimus westermani]|uniref:Uncharacterized protein n=1 Tax=Paragonimus westermani TaxID=34504 RepID=A0A8T0D0J5_9TREM|nr:hypothetical protein P879_03100 [Paragonimus westermani]
MDALRGLVFWHSLGTAITGIDYITAYANGKEIPSGPMKTYTDEGQEVKLIKELPESSLLCPDPSLSSTLRKLGYVASGFDNVLQRINRLEVSLRVDIPTETFAVRQGRRI